MSLYADYIKEREGKDILESDKGFISYKYFPNIKQLYIADIYISPSYRRTRVATDFFNVLVEIAKGLQCTHLGATTDMCTNGWQAAEKGLLYYGFNIVKIDDLEHIVYYSKDI